jgi:tetratricopeptide (TPR) repeat protein
MNGQDRAKIKAQAEKQIKRGRLQDAITELQKLLSGSEQDIPIRTQIGDLYVQAGQKRKAVEELLNIADFYEKKGLNSKAIATLKRIGRVDAEFLEAIRKLASLYNNQGFTSEARTEYAKLAAALAKQNKTDEAIKAYETLLELSPVDMDSRIIMAGLLQKKGKVDWAVEEYNTVAETRIRQNRLEEASKILKKARKLKDDHPRTLTNLIELFKREDKKQEALDLAQDFLKKDTDNIKGLYLLGNLYFERKNVELAEEVFSRIISLRPKEVEARVKMGRLLIMREELDQAFEMYEPLVDSLVRKQMEDKAVGLLGLVLASKQAHLPTLEKLAGIYKFKRQNKNLAIIYGVLIEQYRKNGLLKKVLALLGELVGMFPDNQTYYSDYRFLKGELGGPEGEPEEEPFSVRVDETSEIIDSTLSKVDLYIEQGLFKNARRILDNLMMRYPDEKGVAEKIEEIKQITAEGKTKDIAQKIGKVHKKETELLDKLSGIMPKGGPQAFADELLDGHLSAADIFAETDLIPIVMQEDRGKEKYFDLKDIIGDELDAIDAVCSVQLRGDTDSMEKALTEIVTDFRKVLDEKVDQDDYESHYNLAVAFMGQGLLDEAIKESKLAVNSKKLEIDSLTLVSHCYAQKDEPKEAVRWLEKALEKAEQDSHQSFALKYELASLYESMNDRKNALNFYEEVAGWNPEFRDVTAKLQSLQPKR